MGMAELIDKWEVVNKLIRLENQYNFYKDVWDADVLYRRICELEIGIGKTPPVADRWIPVTERLPESGAHVLVACEMHGQYLTGQYVCDGFYADRYTQKVENIDYDIACEYCEENDEYYLWQGWYEVIKNWDDYNSIVIGDTVTHWMPLPEPPKEA